MNVEECPCGSPAVWQWTLGTRHVALCERCRLERATVTGFDNVLCLFPTDGPADVAAVHGSKHDRGYTAEEAEEIMRNAAPAGNPWGVQTYGGREL